MGNSSSSGVDYSGDTTYSHPEMQVPDAMKSLQQVPHVSRGSLVLVRQKGSSGWHGTCKIDAPVACRVAMYIMAREEITGSITSTDLASPVLALDYGPGMGQSFPGKYTQALQPHTLIKAAGNRFPIVIRVESLATAYASRYDLTSLPPAGSDITQYMNVHTVFAHLKLSAGSWELEVLREHLWVGGSPYLLPSVADVSAYQQLLRKPRLAATPANLRERQQQEQLLGAQALNRARQQQQQQQQQQLMLAAQRVSAAQQALYPPASQVQPQLPLQLPVSQVLAPNLLPGAAPLQYPGYSTAPFTSLAPAAPLQSPFLDMQSPFTQGAPLAPQNAVPLPPNYPAAARGA